MHSDTVAFRFPVTCLSPTKSIAADAYSSPKIMKARDNRQGPYQILPSDGGVEELLSKTAKILEMLSRFELLVRPHGAGNIPR
jgi:hypothetical protein